MSDLTPSATPEWPMFVSWLSDCLDALTRYTTETSRLGMHDLSLLESLRDREAKGLLNCTAIEAMIRLLDRGEMVYIGGPRGGDMWTFFDEDVDEVVGRVGLARVCERHGGPWGGDDTCERCTDSNGEPRPPSNPGPLGVGGE